MAFWSGKRVLITGHTGFKGGWLQLWLQQRGANVVGIALEPNTAPSLFNAARIATGCDSRYCDIRDADRLAHIIKECRPEIVFHLAAQPLVRSSYKDPLETYSSNVMGTANVLNALCGLDSVRVAVMVTTDKVYRNLEHAYPYREDDTLGGHDPYSASKAASEIIIASYRAAFLQVQGISVASARAGNVIGGGDWSADRLIPDAVKAWEQGQTVEIRNPNGIRPWQHVLDPLQGYLSLAEKLWHHPNQAGAYNFGPYTHEAATVRHVIELARQTYDQSKVIYRDHNSGPHEAGWLALETAKSRTVLNVRPKWLLAEAVKQTMAWYQQYYQGADARTLCLTQIAAYESQK